MVKARWIPMIAVAMLAGLVAPETRAQTPPTGRSTATRAPVTLGTLIITGRIQRPMVAVELARLRPSPALVSAPVRLVDRIERDATSTSF